jgi:hypothetical protein
MGFSSFLTNDTQRSISNVWSSRGALSVVMCDNKGNHWEDVAYDGYCNFSGVSYFVLLAYMNGAIDELILETGDNYPELSAARGIGIDLYYKQAEGTLYPNLVESENFFTGWQWVNERPEDCRDQGYFY